MSYNVRVYDYPCGRQIRIYGHDISTKQESLDALLALEYRLYLQGAYNPFTNERLEVDDYETFKNEWISNLTEEKTEKSGNCIERKEIENAKRAKNRIFELSRANVWEWFVTFTFSPEKVDRSNYAECCGKLTQFMNNMRKRYAPDLKYLLLPELHKDGVNWHFHGLLASCGDMEFIKTNIKRNRKRVYNLAQYNLGFDECTRVTDTRRVSTYITKYVTKQLNVVLKGCKRYLRSQNLDEPVITDYKMSDDEIMDMIISVSDDIVYMKQTESDFAGKVRYLEITK